MLRASILTIALLIPGLGYAQEPAAKKEAAAQPCSDYEKSFASCGIPKEDARKAKALYSQAQKLADKKQWNEALDKIRAAAAISPRDTFYNSALMAMQERIVADDLRTGNKAMLKGDATSALAAFKQAAELDPSNEYAQQRLHDALPAPEKIAKMKLRPEGGEIRLVPASGVKSFEFKGSSIDAMDRFAKLFGITAIPDQGLIARSVRIKLDDVSWETGSLIMQRVCKIMVIPLGEHQALVANDSEENRRDLTRMSLRTFYAVGGSTPQELTELATALRTLFDLRFCTPNAAQGSIVIRAQQSMLDAITTFLEYLNDDRPMVMMDVKVFEVSSTFTRDLGTSIPNDFTVFNVGSQINSLVSSSTYQEIIQALESSGQTVNATTILAALLASSASSSSVLGQPFATFGGGLTLSGVTIPSSSLHLSKTNSLASTVEDVMLRAGQGKAATMKVGERYPIVTSQFSTANATSSLLSALGINSTSAASVPSPQFTYEDLGLTLKATPTVHGKLVSLDYELTLRALGATQSNGLPLVTNRESKGMISTEDGESIVMAGLVEKSEINSINGIPLLSVIPLVGQAFSVSTKENEADELLVVLTPHITFVGDRTGSYIPLPKNYTK